MRNIILSSVLLFLGLGLVGDTALAGEQFIFPVGLLFMDNMTKTGWPFDIAAETLVDLRSRGIEVTGLSGIYALSHGDAACQVIFQWVMEDVDTLRKKLARADSFGLFIYGTPRTFEDALKRYGHDSLTVPDSVYFRCCPNQSIPHRYTDSIFRDSLEQWVSWVVDSLNARLERDSVQSLYRYLFWDEPFGKHLYWVNKTGSPWDDYWMNIWEHDDRTGLRTDSLGVYTLLKHQIEQADTLHSVWINLNGIKSHYVDTMHVARGFCQLKYENTPNPPHQFSFDVPVLLYDTKIGDSLRLCDYWTSTIDSIVAAAKEAVPGSPPPVYVGQLQSWGSCRLDTTFIHAYRIDIPEEIEELANLAILHEVKGIIYFVLQSFKEKNDYWGKYDMFANLCDDHSVPFDAPYEDFVYNRDHSLFADPDSLRPFCTNDTSQSQYTDPFRELPPRPQDHPNYHKYLQDYYQWKYAPYARNYNAIGEINNQLHIIGTKLLGLWDADSVARITPDTVYDSVVDSSILPPEIVTFSPVNSSDRYLFFVNKDLTHSEWGFTVEIARYDSLDGLKPVPSSLQSAYILDLSERHLVQGELGNKYITFHAVLGTGEGKLVRLMRGNEAADAMVADPDIEFRLIHGTGVNEKPQYVFTEGDTIRLSARIYNLGFYPLDSLEIKFYDGHRIPANLMGVDTVSLPALDPQSAAPGDTLASILWVSSHDDMSPHNITVFADEPIVSPSADNEANMALLIEPQDYATAVVHNPWDMTERQGPGQPSTPDIDSFKYFVETPDSISGVWEAKTSGMPPNPTIYLHVTSPIDGSKYDLLSARFIQDPGADTTAKGYLKIGWLSTTGIPGSDSIRYAFGKWNVGELNLSLNPLWNGHQIARLWLRSAPLPNRYFKLAWVRLRTQREATQP
jgi:hypothetical protein